MCRIQSVLAFVWLGFATTSAAAEPASTDFQPDPLSVQRYGQAYRYPQAGWIVLHIEGEPYERGYQHGRLLSNEITAYLRCSAQMRGHKAPAEAWNNTRLLVNALFLRRYDKEYLEEMKGIADGAAAAGSKFEGRAVDLLDIVAMNAWPEIETLDGALEATPTGLEGIRFRHDQPRQMPPEKAEHCSAFAATGPATADGKIVFGHITMFGLYPSLFYNVWIDIKPAKGHRVLMQTFPGGMNSGMDYYMNDAGLMVSETTIAQTRFDITGKALASRIRNVMQYADSIDKAVEILKDGNNGLYTNEWLLGDAKTNEIAMFELGTHKSKLYRSSKNEWFGGTEGFYWGCNNAKDLDVRLETVASVNDTPANLVWRPSNRDEMWQRLYHENKGKIDVEFGKKAFTTPPVAAYHSLDAKFTTTDLAKGLRTWALYGPPLGKAWQPTDDERQRYPEVRAMVSNPWTILHPNPPPQKPIDVAVTDFDDKPETLTTVTRRDRHRREDRKPAWHGTILPKTDADIWLAAAFAEYERFVAEELKSLGDQRQSIGETDIAEIVKNNDEVRKLTEKLAKEESAIKNTRFSGGKTNPLYLRLHQRLERDNLRLVALRESVRQTAIEEKGQTLSPEHRHRLGLILFGSRFAYTAGVRGLADVPLQETTSDVSRRDWYKIASGKGVLMLHELRKLMGVGPFTEMMNSFGQDHAGQQVSTADFRAYAAKATQLPLEEFFAFWLTQPRLPEFRLGKVEVSSTYPGYRVEGEINLEAGPPRMKVDITVETLHGESTQEVMLDGPTTAFIIQTSELPKRLVLNKYGWSPSRADATYSVNSFMDDLERTLIIFGTVDEEPSNREAAEIFQRRIVQSGSNITVPVKADSDVTEEDLKRKHLLLIGRPDTNKIVERFRDDFPVGFGKRSFTVDNTVYANAGSSVIAATRGPFDRRYSMVVFAGMSAESTWNMPSKLWSSGAAQVAVFPAKGKMRSMVVPAREMVRDLKEPAAAE